MRHAAFALFAAAVASAATGCGGRLVPDNEPSAAGRADAAATQPDSGVPPADAEAAPDGSPYGCSLGAPVHPFEFVQGPDGCDCMCLPDGLVTCSALTCDSQSAASCDYFGVSFALGEHWPCSDGCNDCFCDEPGLWAMTMLQCPGSTTCEVGGLAVAQGSHVLADDGCNLCTCWGDGAWSCTSSWFCLP